MKKILTTILFIVAATSVWAAKSAGLIRKFVQPDGTQISVRLLGDEHFSWYQTTDDVLLVRDGGRFLIADVTPEGALRSSGILAHDLNERTVVEMSVASRQDRALFFAAGDKALSESRAKSKYPLTSYRFCPHSGTIHIPVILMEYPDRPFVLDDIKGTFDEFFNSKTITPYSSKTLWNGYGSVSAFYTEASNGNMNLVFDLYGPYVTSEPYINYGNKKDHTGKLLYEAVRVSAADIDYNNYDSDNDGYVDMVYVVYAGTGANISNDDNDFWPACYYGMSIGTNSGKTIPVIGGSNELTFSRNDGQGYGDRRAGIGVLCHELSHGLGMPDLYWTLSSPPYSGGYPDYNNCGPEDWDLMDGGENINMGLWPCQYAAWERAAMGWLETEELNEPQDVTIYPLNTEKGKAYRVTNPAESDEYYIIENIAPDGWNYFLNRQNGSGMIITHVNATQPSMTPNNTYGHPNITLLPADEFIMAYYSVGETIPYKGKVQKITDDMYVQDAKADPYPGTQNVTALKAYKNYYGNEDMVKRFPITDIRRNSDGSISFKFMGGSPATVRGDANGDGVVTVTDITATANHILGNKPQPFDPKAADSNLDGNISVTDITYDAQKILNGKFPDE